MPGAEADEEPAGGRDHRHRVARAREGLGATLCLAEVAECPMHVEATIRDAE